ncbi:uncharacterized protein LOC125941051 [Dermacentor silvarum]|uniref:uncharacterized protein LOC125941051 n=1 Tax=Dermacentor silvarum TaxID=543639 RepID=UPI0021014209|nr:uncharacterized protein LOC125941051 [Dermacentor silvarum]
MTTAATPPPVEKTTSSTTTKAPDKQGQIICFADATSLNLMDENALTGLDDLCSKFLVNIEFGKKGEVNKKLPSLQPMQTHFGKNLLTGMKMPEEADTTFLKAVNESALWNLAHSHGLTEVRLTKNTLQKMKNLATVLKEIYVIALLPDSKVNDTLLQLSFFSGSPKSPHDSGNATSEAANPNTRNAALDAAAASGSCKTLAFLPPVTKETRLTVQHSKQLPPLPPNAIGVVVRP